MKKKLTAMLLTLALSAGVLAPVPVYAEDITVGATSMSSAMETKFNTDYTIAWDNNDSKYWNKPNPFTGFTAKTATFFAIIVNY